MGTDQLLQRHSLFWHQVGHERSHLLPKLPLVNNDRPCFDLSVFASGALRQCWLTTRFLARAVGVAIQLVLCKALCGPANFMHLRNLVLLSLIWTLGCDCCPTLCLSRHQDVFLSSNSLSDVSFERANYVRVYTVLETNFAIGCPRKATRHQGCKVQALIQDLFHKVIESLCLGHSSQCFV